MLHKITKQKMTKRLGRWHHLPWSKYQHRLINDYETLCNRKMVNDPDDWRETNKFNCKPKCLDCQSMVPGKEQG